MFCGHLAGCSVRWFLPKLPALPLLKVMYNNACRKQVIRNEGSACSHRYSVSLRVQLLQAVLADFEILSYIVVHAAADLNGKAVGYGSYVCQLF